MYVAQEELQAYYTAQLDQIQASMQSFLTHPDVAHHIAVYNKDVHAAWEAKQPPPLTAKGEVSKRWETWRDREATWMEQNKFNPNSKKQLGWLFFQQMKLKPRRMTDSGQPAIDRKILPGLGEPGKLLSTYNLLIKRRGYIEAVLNKSERDGLIHPQFNSVGTVTGRLGGSGGLNLQQMPKVAEFLHCLRARPGMRLIQADAVALEPTVLAEFSRDKTLWQVYGPGAKPNDIYLLVAAKIPALGKEIRKYYDPDNPTPEGIKAAKKHCKAERDLAKKFHLMSAYKAGPNKIFEELTLAGVDVTLTQVRQIHREYWRLFSGVQRFEEQLKDIWTSHEGWIPSVLGTPICVAESLINDLVNRFCQTSGHQILQMWIANIQKLRLERKVDMWPIIVDLHDETIWEAPEEQAEAAAQVMTDALVITNNTLEMEIKIQGPPSIVNNLAEIKDPDGYITMLERNKQNGQS
jgi:hypothetical protein